jgi:hypothetical protein
MQYAGGQCAQQACLIRHQQQVSLLADSIAVTSRALNWMVILQTLPGSVLLNLAKDSVQPSGVLAAVCTIYDALRGRLHKWCVDCHTLSV